jgi:gamma-glutamyltranspeptidase/glutathione hydrolase
MLRRLLALALCALAAPASADRLYRGGVVASQHPVASAAGLEMLEAGGNAVDAAVATAFTLAVVAPYHSGLGGGGFAVVHLGQEDVALDFREVAPATATADLFVRDGQVRPELATDGALSVAVPNAVPGYLLLHAKYGQLPRAKVLAPAIRAAKQGFVVTPKYRDLAAQRLACLSRDENARRTFLAREGDGFAPPKLGSTVTQPELARTLERLAKEGPALFTTGDFPRAVETVMKREGGLVTARDFTTNTPRWVEPLVGSYRGHRIVTMPPPSAGGVALLQVLSALEAHGPLGFASRDVETLHVGIEALRRAYVDRARYLGDPGFTELPMEELLSKAHVADWLQSIDLKHATPSKALLPSGPVEPPPGLKHTSHLSVVDREGNAVALTTTINYYFGSCVMAPGTGVLLNDQMDDFAAQTGAANVFGLVTTGGANAIAPGKVPLSSMTPTLVFQKGRPTEVMLAVGAPGGSTIPTTVLQVISNVIDGHMGVARAVGQGRIHHQWMPDEVRVDLTGLEPATAAALEALGHHLTRVEGWGDGEAVLVNPDTGLRTGASDPRNEGAPAGQD